MESLSFLWDMDGTLVDSYPAIVPNVIDACAEYGYAIDADTVYRNVIKTSVGSFLESLDTPHTASVKARFQELNDTRIEKIRPMPRALETLSRLREAGHRHFVYTHRGASCRAILENCGLLPYFTEIVTALDGYPRKPAPDAILYLMEKYALAPVQCFYVGDRSLDMEAARNASIGGILLLVPGSPTAPSGYESHVARDLSELCKLFGA